MWLLQDCWRKNACWEIFDKWAVMNENNTRYKLEKYCVQLKCLFPKSFILQILTILIFYAYTLFDRHIECYFESIHYCLVGLISIFLLNEEFKLLKHNDCKHNLIDHYLKTQKGTLSYLLIQFLNICLQNVWQA